MSLLEANARRTLILIEEEDLPLLKATTFVLPKISLG